jgi:phosphatidylglycerophosphate synthase
MKGLPSAISGARLLGAPALAFLILSGRPGVAFAVLAFMMLSDVADGIAARALRASSAGGAYLDVTADFAVVAAGFGSLAVRGVYPWWLLGIFAVMFGQFLATSPGSGPPRYDPIGKRYGGALYATLGLTLAFPDFALTYAITLLILALTTASVASRIAYELRAA